MARAQQTLQYEPEDASQEQTSEAAEPQELEPAESAAIIRKAFGLEPEVLSAEDLKGKSEGELTVLLDTHVSNHRKVIADLIPVLRALRPFFVKPGCRRPDEMTWEKFLKLHHLTPRTVRGWLVEPAANSAGGDTSGTENDVNDVEDDVEDEFEDDARPDPDADEFLDFRLPVRIEIHATLTECVGVLGEEKAADVITHALVQAAEEERGRA